MNEQGQTAQQQPEEEDVGLLDLLIVLAKHKTLVLGLPAAAAVVSVIVSLLLPNIYTGTTKVLPPQQSQSTSAVLAQLGSLAGLAGGAVSGVKNPNDLYVGMLKSRTVTDNLIQRFDLNKLYEQKFQSETRTRLARETRIVAGRFISAPVKRRSDGPAPASGALASDAGKSSPKLLSRLTK